MKELFDEQLSQHINEVFDDFNPAVDEAHWAEMSHRLDGKKGFNKKLLVVFAVAASSLFGMSNDALIELNAIPEPYSETVAIVESVDIDRKSDRHSWKEALVVGQVHECKKKRKASKVKTQVVTQLAAEKEVVRPFKLRKKKRTFAAIFGLKKRKQQFEIASANYELPEINRRERTVVENLIPNETMNVKIRELEGETNADLNDLVAYQDVYSGSANAFSINQQNNSAPALATTELSDHVNGFTTEQNLTMQAIAPPSFDDDEASTEEQPSSADDKAKPLVQTAHLSWDVPLSKSGLVLSPFVKAPLPNRGVHDYNRFLAGGISLSIPIQ